MPQSERRAFLKTAAAGLTANLFTGRVRGANDRIAVGFIGMGTMGSGNLSYAMRVSEAQPVAVCDVYQPHLESAQAAARRRGFEVKAVKDFREILADKSIDAVCISTPDHWHAYMTVEACKAGKDVYVEKPACVYVEEGQKMVAAARKYNRVVQAGTMQRSGGYFKKAAEIVQSGQLGDVTMCHYWLTGMSKTEGLGKPPDSDPPPGFDWDLWLGPAPKRPYNQNRAGVTPMRGTFRQFWDYAGGSLTDWGIHLIDPMHQCLGEPMVKAVLAAGGRFLIEDNTEMPDTMLATFHYPKFIASYEARSFNSMPMFGQTHGTAIHGTRGTLVVNRGGVWVTPTEKSDLQPAFWEKDPELREMNVPHWKNFIECIRTRTRPASEIETCVKSTTVCILGNLSMRLKMRLDWDDAAGTVLQAQARPYLKARYRAPWRLEV
jgi:predicted dehydrogenase